jgi:hypothetical protein
MIDENLPRYRLLAPAFIKRTPRNAVAENLPAGTGITFEGAPGANLWPLNDPARRAAAIYIKRSEGSAQ